MPIRIVVQDSHAMAELVFVARRHTALSCKIMFVTVVLANVALLPHVQLLIDRVSV